MTKQEFLTALRETLSGLSQSDADERVAFYAEIIDDHMEEGLTEAEAVATVGSVEEIILQIVDEYPLTKLVKEKIKPKRRLRAWEIIFLVLGSPIWLSLLIAAFAVLISLYAVLWSVIVSLWSVFVALAGSAVGCVVGGIYFACTNNVPSGLVTIAAALVCAGLAIFTFLGCKAATKCILLLTKKMMLAIKKRCMRKEEAQ